jgi:hypothetical protein
MNLCFTPKRIIQIYVIKENVETNHKWESFSFIYERK